MTDSGYVVHEDKDTREAKTTLRIKEKIAVLEKWFEDGVPEGYQWQEAENPDKKFGVPTNFSEFHKWNDPELRLTVKVDGKKYNVEGVYPYAGSSLYKPDRKTIKKRATDLLRDIKKRPTPKKEMGKVKAEKKALEALTQQLVNENVELNALIDQLREYLETAKDEISLLKNRVKDQEVELRKIKPIGPRLVR